MFASRRLSLPAGRSPAGEFTAYVEESAPDKDFGGIWEEWLYGEGRPARP
ncbi:hypothetical protein [Streptomyces sp. NPDC004976]